MNILTILITCLIIISAEILLLSFSWSFAKCGLFLIKFVSLLASNCFTYDLICRSLKIKSPCLSLRILIRKKNFKSSLFSTSLSIEMKLKGIKQRRSTKNFPFTYFMAIKKWFRTFVVVFSGVNSIRKFLRNSITKIDSITIWQWNRDVWR